MIVSFFARSLASCCYPPQALFLAAATCLWPGPQASPPDRCRSQDRPWCAHFLDEEIFGGFVLYCSSSCERTASSFPFFFLLFFLFPLSSPCRTICWIPDSYPGFLSIVRYEVDAIVYLVLYRAERPFLGNIHHIILSDLRCCSLPPTRRHLLAILSADSGALEHTLTGPGSQLNQDQHRQLITIIT